MNRLQKKCFLFSLGMHGLVAVTILLASAGFRDRPQTSDLHIMSIIPANIVDRAGTGGGSPSVTLNQPPQQLRQAAPPAPIEHVQRPAPREPERIERPAPEPKKSDDAALQPTPKAHKPAHEIHPTYTSASDAKTSKKPEKNQSRESSTQAESQRLKDIQESLNQLANGVKNSGAASTIVDVSGIGGGEAFAGYRDVIFNAYYRAWVTPDSVTDRTASADAKVTIARDGTIRSAELVRPSGNGALDKSVERALRSVTKLPPFPASARDEERTFTIQFSLEAKDTPG
jgi:TonB family protein